MSLRTYDENTQQGTTSTHESEVRTTNDVMQTLTALRAEDPAFGKVIDVQQVKRGAVVATADDLTPTNVCSDQRQREHGLYKQ